MWANISLLKSSCRADKVLLDSKRWRDKKKLRKKTRRHAAQSVGCDWLLKQDAVLVALSLQARTCRFSSACMTVQVKATNTSHSKSKNARRQHNPEAAARATLSEGCILLSLDSHTIKQGSE